MRKTPDQLPIYPQGRIIGFDFLRGFATILTLFRHTYNPGNILYEIGWISVHIFFVLSSFLIIDILLKEYFKTGKIDYLGFFIRRSLKIYPLYYLFILLSVIYNRNEIFSSAHNIGLSIGQIFHIQNYVGCLWYHTWSLGAEEHFYLCICLLLILLLKYRKTNFVKGLMIVCGMIVVAAPLFRYVASVPVAPTWFQQTHHIMDSFAWGGLLAGCKYAYPRVFYGLLSLKQFLLIPIVLLAIPLFVFPIGSLQLNTFGHTFLYLAVAISLAYLIQLESYARQKNLFSLVIIKPLSWIGIASYSIYLFHVGVRGIVDKMSLPEVMRVPVYVIASILFGRILWWLVEKRVAGINKSSFNFEWLSGKLAQIRNRLRPAQREVATN